MFLKTFKHQTDRNPGPDGSTATLPPSAAAQKPIGAFGRGAFLLKLTGGAGIWVNKGQPRRPYVGTKMYSRKKWRTVLCGTTGWFVKDALWSNTPRLLLLAAATSCRFVSIDLLRDDTSGVKQMIWGGAGKMRGCYILQRYARLLGMFTLKEGANQIARCQRSQDFFISLQIWVKRNDLGSTVNSPCIPMKIAKKVAPCREWLRPRTLAHSVVWPKHS